MSIGCSLILLITPELLGSELLLVLWWVCWFRAFKLELLMAQTCGFMLTLMHRGACLSWTVILPQLDSNTSNTSTPALIPH